MYLILTHADIIVCDGSYMYLSCPVGQVCMCARGLWARTWLSHLSSQILSKPGYKLRFDNIHCKGIKLCKGKQKHVSSACEQRRIWRTLCLYIQIHRGAVHLFLMSPAVVLLSFLVAFCVLLLFFLLTRIILLKM